MYSLIPPALRGVGTYSKLIGYGWVKINWFITNSGSTYSEKTDMKIKLV